MSLATGDQQVARIKMGSLMPGQNEGSGGTWGFSLLGAKVMGEGWCWMDEATILLCKQGCSGLIFQAHGIWILEEAPAWTTLCSKSTVGRHEAKEPDFSRSYSKPGHCSPTPPHPSLLQPADEGRQGCGADGEGPIEKEKRARDRVRCMHT